MSGSSAAMRRLHPDCADTTAAEATSGLDLGELAPAERPYVVLNMVASADGAATVAGRTRELSDPIDREVFHGLRTQADCVMVGAGTVRSERYGRLVKDPALRERRVDEGRAADPLACVVSGRLDLPVEVPLLQDADARVVIGTSSDGELTGAEATLEYVRAGPPLELATILRSLRERHGVRSVLCEGGPRLNASLLKEDLVDELFLTIAPKLVAGTPQMTIVAGLAREEPVGLDLVSAHQGGGALYLRQRLRR